MSYLSKAHSPHQQIWQSLAYQANCNTSFSFLSWKERVLQRTNT